MSMLPLSQPGQCVDHPLHQTRRKERASAVDGRAPGVAGSLLDTKSTIKTHSAFTSVLRSRFVPGQLTESLARVSRWKVSWNGKASRGKGE